MAQNLAFARANVVRSSLYETWLSRLSARSGLMPSASASRALRFAIPHSFVHFSCWPPSRAAFVIERPQGTDWRMRPHEQLMVTIERHGSDSSHDAGAWHESVHGWMAGMHSLRGFPQGAWQGPHGSPWQSRSQWWKPQPRSLTQVEGQRKNDV